METDENPKPDGELIVDQMSSQRQKHLKRDINLRLLRTLNASLTHAVTQLSFKRKANDSCNDESNQKRRKVMTTPIIKCVHCGKLGHHVSICRFKRKEDRWYTTNFQGKGNKKNNRNGNKCQGAGNYSPNWHHLISADPAPPPSERRVVVRVGSPTFEQSRPSKMSTFRQPPRPPQSDTKRNIKGVTRTQILFSGSRSSSSGAPRIIAGNSNYDSTRKREVSIQRNSKMSYPINRFQQQEGSSRDKSQGNLQRRDNRYTGARGHNISQERPRRNHQFSGSVHFMTLKKIADSDKMRIIALLNRSKKEFMDTINSPIQDLDVIVLVIEILSKVSQSPFEDSKSKLMLDACNSNFISTLRNYLLDLPYTEKKTQNRLYWEDQESFWKNLIIFCGDIVDTSPGTAVRTCRSLIDSVIRTCLDGLNQNHNFVLSENKKLDELRQKLTSYVNRNKPDTKVTNVGDPANVDIKPPEDFRELSVIPTRDDLLNAQPFLRPNITEGGYSNVEQYLDIQFRLLREDCFGPMRVGVNQYLSNSSKWKYDHVRVYRNVKFMGPYISNLKIGNLVQFDTANKKYFKKINWTHSKRLLFGSLVLFTKDCFQNCIVATILDRDIMLLATGKIAVSIIDRSLGVDINSDDTYTMIESEVYYEPYYHVLRALQAPLFALHMPMQGYIVKVDASSKKPSYITDDMLFSIPVSKTSYIEADGEMIPLDLNIENDDKIIFNISNPGSWPSKETFQFNESQFEAFKLALTHEFAVIQGPPGTGKTYVGLKVAETLLRNVQTKNNNALMLIVCYTNHALDQFLEGISKVTKDILRIGSQSRNKSMDEYNLINIRNLRNIHMSGASRYFMETKENLKDSIADFRETLVQLDILNNGVINYEVIQEIQEIRLLCDYYSRFPDIKDPLEYWLFEGFREYYSRISECLAENEYIMDENDNELNNRRRECDYGIIMNDDKDTKECVESLYKKYNSFLIINAKRMLKDLIARYKVSQTNELETHIKYLNAKIKLFEDMTRYRSETIHLNITASTDFSSIATQNRWCLYFMWIRSYVRSLEQHLAGFQESISSGVALYEEARMMMDMELLRHKKIKVLGMTTSGAARMRKLIQAISPTIVIVEEAAEVLEQHIITSLPRTCKHLILIGDHQQLRPSASYIKLVKQYNIEVSLFERMIKNGIHSRTLNVQHRMRPEIAALVSPHIYPQLENHPTVETYGDVPGLEKNVFFFTHEYQEEENTNDSVSQANYKEADIVLALANYLIQQGYKCDEVTILAAYSGQMFYMRKEQKSYANLSGVKITVVDNYQGEESKIILLSLVRNNPENNIGFLGIENRVCVALSRAKQGFYIFGNINMLKIKSELWTKIAATLEEKGSLGTAIYLKCQNHPDELTPVTNVKDFDKAPEGGCTRICNYQFTCGHICSIFCHGYDRQHKDAMRCPKKCERIICDLNHKCPLNCRDECQPCEVYVPKILPCGHEQKVFCHRSPDDPKNKCLYEVEVTLSQCGHKARKLCYVDIKDVICKEKCKKRLEKCGHTCELRCHVGMECSELKYQCKKECTKANKGCSAELTEDLGDHKCKKMCYEACNDCNVQVVKRRSNCRHLETAACCQNIDDKPCLKKCTRLMTCGHHCKKKCYEKCGDCVVMVPQEIPECKHIINLLCKVTVKHELCYEKCSRTRSCGHPCKSRCGADCEQMICTHLVSEEVSSPCGHKTKLPCNAYSLFVKGELNSKDILKHCKNPCRADLTCGHICSGSCSDCHQGRLHIPCKQTCNQLNICGHQCQEPCNQMCPPCRMPCEVKCAHSKCGRLCGQPCVVCKEKCNRSCAHGACSRLCYQKCSLEPCSLPCPLTLPCKHRCRGICGEPCPNICRDCRPEEFPKDFTGYEYDEEDKFILLQDCGHSVELETMDSIMTGHQENIKMSECPYCRKPVINTNRYKRVVNDMIKNEINPIKTKVYGNSEQIKKRFKELEEKIKSIYSKYFEGGNVVAGPFAPMKQHLQCSNTDKSQTNLSKDAQNIKKIFSKLISVMKNKKKYFLLQVEMLIAYCNIIEMVTESWQKFVDIKTTILEEEYRENLDIILKVLDIKFHPMNHKIEIKISEQQQKDVGNELKRLNAIAQLAKLLSVHSSMINSLDSDEKVKFSLDTAKTAVLTLSIFDEVKAIESLKTLQSALKSSVIVTKLEREMVVKAMNMKAGHWFKCPNGHFYCIGDCGGANQVAKCPDCGSLVGGTNHRLLPGNAHAREMDGSRFAAYSEEANNMANFMLDFA